VKVTYNKWKSGYPEKWLIPRRLSVAPGGPLYDEDDCVGGPDEQQQDQEVGQDPLRDDLPVLLLKKGISSCLQLSRLYHHRRSGDVINVAFFAL
jgi:hypothetical protein